MTTSGENYAQAIIDLFDRNNTLSEFNSGTYTGVSLYGLTLWCKYLPADSIMAQRGPSLVRYTWEAVGQCVFLDRASDMVKAADFEAGFGIRA